MAGDAGRAALRTRAAGPRPFSHRAPDDQRPETRDGKAARPASHPFSHRAPDDQRPETRDSTRRASLLASSAGRPAARDARRQGHASRVPTPFSHRAPDDQRPETRDSKAARPLLTHGTLRPIPSPRM
ncbi:hypothetical protein AURDEDRAFT_175069 [Auricularia subglabra TFB-10046 SS5]|nr:hypothetical protein AURDEDRAFT_175069 [Auricularia subglabra TFB-10046 SS5]